MPCSVFLPPKRRYFLSFLLGMLLWHLEEQEAHASIILRLRAGTLRQGLFRLHICVRICFHTAQEPRPNGKGRCKQAKRGQQEDGKRQCNREKH